MAALLPLVNTGVDYIGWMRPEVWAGMEQDVLTQPVSIDQVYTQQFLVEVYETEQ